MPAISMEDAAVLRQFPQVVRRYLSVAPREVVMAARVSSVEIGRDALSGGVVTIPYDSVTEGAYTDLEPGMTLDIGTTEGGAEIGQVRVRAVDSGQIAIAETDVAGLSAGKYLTVRREFRPWAVRPRRSEAWVDAAYPTSFIEYHDYDVAYSDENQAIAPKANITAEGYTPVKPAGFVDAGEETRTITLSAEQSVALATGAAISGWAWDIGDGVLLGGALDDETITVAFPVGFRYVTLTVTDTNGTTGLMRLPIWVHWRNSVASSENMPITAFGVMRDETRSDRGREMRFEVFASKNDASDADAGVIPEGSAICYWEEADFGEDVAPGGYRGQFLGWATRDAVLFRLYRSRYLLDVEGAAGWLDRIGGLAQTLLDPGRTPLHWHEMQGLTLDRAAHYALRSYSNLLTLVNFYPSGVEDAAQTIDLSNRSVWSQIGELVKGYSGTAGCDTLGGIWLRRHLNHLSAEEQAAITPVISLSSTDWTDAHGLLLAAEKTEPVALVEGSGASFDGTTVTRLASRARGNGVPSASTGVGQARMPFQVVSSQEQLNELTGRYLARLNNPRKAVTLRLLGNLDVVEPAWGEPITISGAGANVRGLTLNEARLLVTGVSVEHSNAPGKPPKAITWTLEGATSGEAGITLDVPEPAVKPPKPPAQPRGGKKIKPVLLSPGIGTIAAPNDDGYVYVTRNFSAYKPTWTRYALGDLGMSGTLLDFVPDPFSPLYLGTGASVNGWLVTDSEIGRLADIFGTPGYTVQYTFAATVDPGNGQRVIETERSTPGFVVVASYYHDAGTTAIVTTDGETWGAETTLTSYTPAWYLSPGVAVSGKQPGVAYTAAVTIAGTFQGYQYSGGSWSPMSSPDISGDRLPGWIHIPWHDNDDSLVYYGAALPDAGSAQVYRARGAARTDITPLVDGHAYTCRYPRSVDTPALNHQRVVLCGLNDPSGADNRNAVFASKNGGATWKAIYGPEAVLVAHYLSVRCAGDDPDVFYLFGPEGRIAYSADFGATRIKSKRGNLADFTGMGRFVNICGG